MRNVARIIGHTELRRSIRIALADPTRVVTIAILFTIGVGPLLLGIGIGSFVAGRAIGDGSAGDVGSAQIITIVRGIVAFAWLAIAGLATLRAATQTGVLDLPDVLLIGTSLRNVVLGVVYGEFLKFCLFVVPLGGLIGVPMAIGSGLFLIAVAVPVVALFSLLTAVPAGFAVGLAIRHVFTSYRPIARLRVPIVIAAAAAYVAVLVSARFNPALVWFVESVGRSPFAWPGELVVLILPGVSGDLWRIAAAIAVTGVAIPVWIEVGERIAASHWYRDRGRGGGGFPWPRLSLIPLERALSGRVDRPVLAVCLTTLRRTKRAPVRMLYVIYPVIGSIYFLVEIIRRGDVPFLFFVMLSLYVVWGTGALVTLNPLGDLGAVLATLATSPIRGGQVMAGYRLASWLVGIPVATLVVVAAGVIATPSSAQIAILALGTVIGVLLSPSLALGVGAMFPRFGTVRVTHRREAVMPSKLAFSLFTTFFSIPATAVIVLASPRALDVLIAVVAYALGLLGSEAAAVSEWFVTLTLVVPALCSIPLALIAFRFACYRYDGYTLP